MNNGMFTTIPLELDSHTEMSPDEEMADYIATFDNNHDEVIEIDLFRVQNQLDRTFFEAGYSVFVSSRPIDKNPFHCTFGFDTPKDEVKYLTALLDDFGIEYTVMDGAYKNTSARWTNKRNAYVQLAGGIDDYYRIYAKTDEIPFLVGDVII